MPWIRISQFDANGGSVGDVPPQAVPPGVFTKALNVQFVDGAVEKAPGMAQLYGTPPAAPYFLLSGQDNGGNIKVFLSGLTQIYAYASGFSNVSRAVGGNYAATEQNVWTGGVLHGVPFLNNIADIPQSWDSGTSLFVDMPNWTAGDRAKSLRAFKNYLLALNISNGANNYPHNVKWSHPADPGVVPSSWNVADATKDAGEATLSDTPGHIIDGLSMGNQFAIYKEDATYLMQFIGAPFIFSFKLIMRESGVLALNCVADVLGQHVILTGDDVILFNGAGSPDSIMNRKWRRELYNNLNINEYKKTFIAAMPTRQELWCCIPTTTGNPPDVAYVWNWKNNSWSKRDIPQIQSIASSFPPDTGTATWDTDAGTWNSDAEAWSSFGSRGKVPLMASPKNTKILTYGAGELLDSTVMSAVATHESYDFATPEDGKPADVVKHVSKLRPRVVADPGVVVNFEIGTQFDINDPIEWGSVLPFTVGTTQELCMARNGKYISWRVSSNTDCTWRLEALDMLVQLGGRY